MWHWPSPNVSIFSVFLFSLYSLRDRVSKGTKNLSVVSQITTRCKLFSSKFIIFFLCSLSKHYKQKRNHYKCEFSTIYIIFFCIFEREKENFFFFEKKSSLGWKLFMWLKYKFIIFQLTQIRQIYFF